MKFNYEQIFKFTFFGVLASVLYSLPGALRFRAYVNANNILSFQIHNLIWLIVGLVIIHVSKKAQYKLCYEYVLFNLNSKFSGKDRIQRAQKVTKWIYDVVYYTMTCTAAYVLFKDEVWYPAEMGGTDFTSLLAPYPAIPTNKWLPIYYMFQAASNLHKLLLLIYYGQALELKYWEYILHHSLAVSLIYYSSIYNTVCHGVMVLITHDASDIFLSLGRADSDLGKPHKIRVFVEFSLIQLSWIYTRCYVFPLKIYETLITLPQFQAYEFWEIIRFGLYYQVVLKIVLFGMHVYWTYYMVKVGLGIFSSGKYKNVYDNRENKLDDKKED